MNAECFGVYVSNFEIKCKHRDIIAIEIELVDEDFVIVAYGDGNVPSLILQNQETRKFSKIHFNEFEGFKVWSADLTDSLKVCLVK